MPKAPSKKTTRKPSAKAIAVSRWSRRARSTRRRSSTCSTRTSPRSTRRSSSTCSTRPSSPVPQYDAIRPSSTIHSNEEHRTPSRCRTRSTSSAACRPWTSPRILVSPDSKTMLEQDLEGELDAIARYKERIAQAEMLQEYGLRRALEDILIIEEEHARDLQNALEPVRRGEAARAARGGQRPPPLDACHVGARLHLVHARVLAVERDELVVGAALDDAALVDDVDAVGVAHRREAVADEDHGAPAASSRMCSKMRSTPPPGRARSSARRRRARRRRARRRARGRPSATRRSISSSPSVEPLAQHGVVAGAQSFDDLVRAGVARRRARSRDRPRPAPRCPSRCSGAP